MLTKHFYQRLILSTAATTLAVLPASAATVVQTFTYLSDEILIDSSVVGTGNPSYSLNDGSKDPVLSAQPFNSLLGTLESFTVTFALTYDGSQTNGGGIGSFSISSSGNFLFNGISLGGSGQGSGNGGPAFANLTASFPINFSRTMFVADAGVLYDPALLSAVTGNSGFEVRHPHTPTISPDGQVSAFRLSLREGSSVTLTYNYAPIPEPGTAALALLALGFATLRRRRF